MIRIAKSIGDVSSLFPPGITHLADVPHHLADAISKGLAFISFDELPSDEKPPRKIWLDEELLSEWFDEVAKRREEKFNGESKEIDDPVSNEAAKALIAR